MQNFLFIQIIMQVKNSRLEALKMLISSMELSSQEEVLKELEKEGFKLTQATLSRDLKQLILFVLVVE